MNSRASQPGREAGSEVSPGAGQPIVKMVRGWQNGVSVGVLASYDPGDPYAVTLQFGTRPRVVEWGFARSLLSQVLSAPSCAPGKGPGEAVGEGDIRFQGLDEGTVRMLLRSPGGEAVIDLDHASLAAFWRATERAVAEGTERMDWDAIATRMLRGEGSR